MAFRNRADIGPLLTVFRSSLPKKRRKTKQIDIGRVKPPLTNLSGSEHVGYRGHKLDTNWGRSHEFTYPTPDRWQLKTHLKIDERGSNITRNSVFDCNLSQVGHQMAIENCF